MNPLRKQLRLAIMIATAALVWAAPHLFAQPVPMDFGDAPPPYPTLLQDNGARHQVIQGIPSVHLGATVDTELDGQPDPLALGDDNSTPPPPPPGADDEDGVIFLTSLTPGQTATVQVICSADGRLDAWVDFDANGSWAETPDQIFTSQLLLPGTNILHFVVPPNAHVGFTFARFRVSRQGGLSFVGPAPDGEVEDYRVGIQPGQESADVLLTKRSAPNPATVGQQLTYTLIVQNNGPAPAVNVVVNDPLPPNVNFISATASQGSCAPINGTVVCSLGNLAVNATANITIIVVPTSAVLLTNTACVSAGTPDPKSNNNCSTTSTEVNGGQNPPPCDRTNKGTDFWLTFPANYAPDATNRPQLSFDIAGVPGTLGQVTIPGLSFSTGFTIPASMIATVNLPWQADLAELNDAVTNKGIHVTAQAEVAVYALNHVPFTSDAYLALPTDVLGLEYLVLGYGNVHTDVPELSGTQFALVATENNTTVTITPPVATGVRAAGFPFTITLNQGDTYQLRNSNNAPNDLSGTVITADQPIAVFAGHQCANIPDANTFFCDTVVEQLLPTATWGTNFVALPLATRSFGDAFRFLAAQSNTTVSVNGALAATLNRGEFFEQSVSGPVHITSDKSILVAQFANSSDYDNVINADPFMVLIPPTKLFRTDYLVSSLMNGFTSHYLNVVVPNSLVGAVLLDGGAIPSGSYTAIPTTSYSGATIAVAAGKHSLTQSTPVAQPFGVTVYGYAQFDSYGYPAGMRFADFRAPTISCPSNITITINPAVCAGLVPMIEATAHDNCTPENFLQITQSPPAGTPVGAGLHNITLTTTDAAGNVGSCVTKLTVLDTFTPTINCPSNIVVRCNRAGGATVTFNATASTPCSPNLPVQCQPPSGSFFPLGTTKVNCITSSSAAPLQCSFTVTVNPLVIRATLENQNVVLRWPGPETLEAAPEVTGPWKAVPNGVSPFVIPVNNAARLPRQFFRLRCADLTAP